MRVLFGVKPSLAVRNVMVVMQIFVLLSPNPPKDIYGRREDSGRVGEGATGEMTWAPLG